MTGEPIITVAGHLTADPELRFTPNGAAVANFTIASTPRTYDRQTNEWKDGETLFVRSSAWRDLAENVAASLTKGDRVVAEGYLKARSYQDREGNNRTAWELDVQDIGPSLKRATAQVQRVQRNSGGGGGFGGQPQGGGNWSSGGQGAASGGFGGQPSPAPTGSGFGGQRAAQPAPADDPWTGDGGWGAPSSNEPPF